MTSKVKDDYEELNYCSLDFQCNVYSLAVINLKSGDKKLLAAPLRGNGLCIDMQHNVPIIKPIPFNPIPADCDLVSIDAMNQVARSGKIFIGITFTKSSESYLNIYSQESDADDADFNVDNLICCCQLKLEYVPLQLYHTEVFKGEDNIKSVFVLSGLDGKIHVYEESPRNNFTAVDVEEYFPEFATFTGFATCMQCVNLGRKTRLTFVGLRDGRSFAFVVDLEENKILKTYLTDHDDVITSLTIFNLNYHSADPNTDQDIANYNVLITTAFEQSVVYRRVFKSGFSLINVLAQSNLYDCCLCGVAVDLDLDGVAELVLGTYGKRLLYYKLLPLDPTTTTTTIATTAAASAAPTNCPTDPPATKPSATKIKNSNRNSNRDDPAAHLTISPLTSTSSTTTLKSLASSSSASTILPAGSFSSIISHSLTSGRQSTTTLTASASTTTTAAAAAATTTTTTTTTTKNDVLKAGIVANTSNNSSSNLGGDFINVPGDGDDADDNPDNDDDDDSQSITSRNSVSQSEQLGFKLVEMKDLNEPIMALQPVDLTSDSLKELVVMTLKGVHILQKNLHNVMLILKERLNASPE
ncbi:hypothetical protein HELRODRAFT_191874 [Helobdella robusta]|uniref:Kaptin n=1 Tax=Helobdella robusta TaxID=6412 RepID=T1FTD6_HELRO|nr:hypothetical protein HELRODRAFT_191874 [Helobdella robusta]ESO03568.1 hypothetical protein HELRODRAFT_191874 [Helobdella robusta]